MNWMNFAYKLEPAIEHVTDLGHFHISTFKLNCMLLIAANEEGLLPASTKICRCG